MTKAMSVQEVGVYIDISFHIEETEEQLKQLVREASLVNGSTNFVPRTVTICCDPLFDFLYIVSYEITRYREIDSLYIKYLKATR